MFKELTNNDIKSIFKNSGLATPIEIKKINVGFSNDVFSINEKYVLKSAKAEENNYLEREIYLCNLLKDKLPTAKIVYFNTTKQFIDRAFVIYEKVQGENLYLKWHEYSELEKRNIIKDICDFLKIINDVPYEDYAVRFDINTSLNWQDMVMSKINEYLSVIKDKHILEVSLITKVETFIEQNKAVLDEEKIALTYYDPHFDNFIVRGKKIVAMLDFERCDVFSIDFVLDLVQRMVLEPKKYASEHAENLIVVEDYAKLMDWYKEFYPELFDFTDMDTRIALYSIAYDLKERIMFTNIESKQRLMNVVG